MAIKFMTSPPPPMDNKVLSTPVPLSSPQAKMLGQTVKGTSSHYKVFCYCATMAVAVRKESGKISIRVEPQSGCSIPGELMAYLQTLGIEKKDYGASGHLKYEGITPFHVLAPVAFNPVVEWQAICRDLTKCL